MFNSGAVLLATSSDSHLRKFIDSLIELFSDLSVRWPIVEEENH